MESHRNGDTEQANSRRRARRFKFDGISGNASSGTIRASMSTPPIESTAAQLETSCMSGRRREGEPLSSLHTNAALVDAGTSSRRNRAWRARRTHTEVTGSAASRAEPKARHDGNAEKHAEEQIMMVLIDSCL